MPGNMAPLFTATPVISRGVWTNSTTANTDSDGSGTVATDMVLIATGATNGSYLTRVRFSPAATAASTATTASIHRLFLSTKTSGATTSADTWLIGEVAAPTQTAAAPTASVQPIDFPLGFYIPSGTTLLWSMHHAAAASTLWHAVVFAGDY